MSYQFNQSTLSYFYAIILVTWQHCTEKHQYLN